MKKYLVSLAVGAWALVTAAQVSNVSPVPHTVTLGNVYDARTAKVTEGIVGDAVTGKKVKKYAALVPEKAESYYMTINKKGRVVIAARDEQGLFYAKQTLRQIMADGKLQECTITDWPDVTWRGVVEGFYGQPWSHEHRLRQLDFYGENKMNVYIFGPKDDPYHKDHWREPYPAKEAKQIQELLERAKKNHVRFYWAIHPGVDIKWNDADRDNLVRKLNWMYDLGVRSFAVFFDDIAGEGAKGDKQAGLLNYVDEHFVKAKGDVTPLVLCPTEYNRSWSSDNSPYLNALGTTLNKGIQVMWTGNAVVTCIDKEGLQWVNERIRRKAYIWWNFPVSDFVRDHVLLGPAYGNGKDIADEVSGFVSNPMQFAESSKLSLYNIADYTWNMQAYDYTTSWEKAVRNLMPKTAEALRTFAVYNEDLGPNGHGFRRDESRHMQGYARQAGEGNVSGTRLVHDDCVKLHEACDELLKSDENPWLIDELRPWLVQGKMLAEYGEKICDMALDGSRTEELYPEIKALSKKMYDYENDESIRHPFQTGVKLGTLLLQPALEGIFYNAVNDYNCENGKHLNPIVAYQPFHVSATVRQLSRLPIAVRGDEVTVTPSNEIITWPVDSHFDITMESATTLQGLDFNFGMPDQAKNFRLEGQLADGTWQNISLCHYRDGEQTVHTGNEVAGMQVKALRLTNVSGEELKLYFRSFRFVKR